MSADSTGSDTPDDADADDQGAFAFDSADFSIVLPLIDFVRVVLRRKALRSRDIVSIGRLLHGLERLPYPTPGLHVSLLLTHAHGGENIWQSVFLNDSEFSLRSGGYMNAGAGGDSFSSTEFEVTFGGRDDEGGLGWLNGFQDRAGDTDFEVETEDESDQALDLRDTNEDPWGRCFSE